MKKILQAFVLLLLIFFSFSILQVQAAGNSQIDIYFFYDDACSHCYQEGLFLDEMETTYPEIVVHRYEVTMNSENAALFEEVKTAFNAESSLTPFLVIGGVSLEGYNDQIAVDIETMIIHYQTNEMTNVVLKIQNNETVLPSDILDITDFRDSMIDLPILGLVDIEHLSLGLAAVVIGFVDGFNPCAMWVLIFLITLLVQEQNRKKMWLLGSVFLFTSALMYFLIMVAWLHIALEVSMISWVRIAIGVFALGFGSYHIFGFFKDLKNKDVGCDVTDEKQKRAILDKVKKVVLEKRIFLALIGIITLAVSVNFIELACSAGLPLLFTQILSYHDLSLFGYYGYILLYILFFLIDDLIVFFIAMVTFQATGISNKYSKWSKIIGGVIMFIIGFLLVFFPAIVMFQF